MHAREKYVFASPLVNLLVAVLATGATAHAQSSGTILGTGVGQSPGGRDPNWTVVAVPEGFTPPASLPYEAYVTSGVPNTFLGGGTPQTGYTPEGSGTTYYWITPQNTTANLLPFPNLYNWVAQQQFTVQEAGFYRFDFKGAGDNELEFFIGGTVNTSRPTRPTITGGQQVGGRQGGFASINTFTGGAELVAGTNTASVVIWDYGFDTGAILETTTFTPAVAYWAPGAGAGGNGTWTNANAFWTSAANGSGTKEAWTEGVGVAYFGGTAGTVSVGEAIAVDQMYFTTGGYVVEGGGGALTFGSGGTITARTGLGTVSANVSATQGSAFAPALKIAGSGTVALAGTTTLGFGQQLFVDGGNLLVNGTVSGNSAVYVSSGKLGGTGFVGGQIAGSGRLDPGLFGADAGILATNQLNPSDGLDFTLFYDGTTPTYGNLSDSGNDVLRITANPQFVAPFTSALTSANSKTLFLNMTKAELALGTILEGGFFTDSAFDFTSLLNNETRNNAGFQVYVLGDGLGTDNSYNGQGYYNWRNPAMFGWDQSLFMSTTARTANFGSGDVNGQVMLLTIAVPEPGTMVPLITGGLGLALMTARWRKRTLPKTASQAEGLRA